MPAPARTVCAALLAVSTLTLASACQSADRDDFVDAKQGGFPEAVQSVADQAAKENKPALFIISAPWDAESRRFADETLSDPETRAYLEDNTVFRELDYDENKNLLRRLGVSSTPATLLFVDGQPKARLNESVSSERLIEWIERNS